MHITHSVTKTRFEVVGADGAMHTVFCKVGVRFELPDRTIRYNFRHKSWTEEVHQTVERDCIGRPVRESLGGAAVMSKPVRTSLGSTAMMLEAYGHASWAKWMEYVTLCEGE